LSHCYIQEIKAAVNEPAKSHPKGLI